MTRPPLPAAFDDVATALDPVLVPLGFAAAQAGATESSGQVIFCRGDVDGVEDGCVDLVIDVERHDDDWRIVDVRYWGFTSDRWHLPFERDTTLALQLSDLARTLPGQLSDNG